MGRLGREGRKLGGLGIGTFGWAVLCLLSTTCLALAQEVEKKKLPLHKLDDQTRAKALAALAGLVILGLAMLAFIWLGARITWRYRSSSSRYEPPLRTTLDLDDWARKPLVEGPRDEEPRGENVRHGGDNNGDGEPPPS